MARVKELEDMVYHKILGEPIDGLGPPGKFKVPDEKAFGTARPNCRGPRGSIN